MVHGMPRQGGHLNIYLWEIITDREMSLFIFCLMGLVIRQTPRSYKTVVGPGASVLTSGEDERAQEAQDGQCWRCTSFEAETWFDLRCFHFIHACEPIMYKQPANRAWESRDVRADVDTWWRQEEGGITHGRRS